MAESKHSKEGQIPLPCQLCEEFNQIKWKCIECNFLLCTKCKTLHQKVKSTDKHNIIDIKQNATNFQSSPYFGNIKCRVHSGQMCCLFCEDCELVVCPVCVAKTHNKHNMVEIREGFEMSLGKLKTCKHELRQNIKDLRHDVSVFAPVGTPENTRYESEKEKILSQDKALKDAVEKQTKKLLNELDYQWNAFQKSSSDEATHVSKLSQDLESRDRNIEKALKSNNADEVFEAVFRENKSRRTKTVTVNLNKRLPQFIPREITQSKIEMIHGSIEKQTNNENKDSIESIDFEVNKQFVTDFPVIEGIVCCSDESMWICSSYSNSLQKVHTTFDDLYVAKTNTLRVFNMAMLSCGGLLLSTMEPELKVLSNTGEIQKSTYSVAPLLTTAVHISVANKIIVGAREGKEAFPVNGPRKVIVFDVNGRQEKKYHLDEKNRPLFTSPTRITTDEKNNIYIIDRFSKNIDGRIVILRQTSEMKVYTGNPEIQNSQLFKPTDLATSSDKIIVADTNNHLLHILNALGQVVKYITTKDQEIYLPTSLCFDKRGMLVIGCNTRDGDPENAKIYVIKFS